MSKPQYEVVVDLGVTIDVSLEEFSDMLIEFFESHGWYCGGGINYSDDPMNDDIKNK